MTSGMRWEMAKRIKIGTGRPLRLFRKNPLKVKKGARLRLQNEQSHLHSRSIVIDLRRFDMPTKSKTAECKNVVTPQLKSRTKPEIILSQLESESGASLLTLVEITGWQKHSIRAVISSLRKSGIVVEKAGRGTECRYRALGKGSASHD